jgi:hypothetical protein
MGAMWVANCLWEIKQYLSWFREDCLLKALRIVGDHGPVGVGPEDSQLPGRFCHSRRSSFFTSVKCT